MKLYLAARYTRRLEIAGYAEALKALGHAITSRWLAGNDELPVPAQVRMDLEDIDKADALMIFADQLRPYSHHSGGRHVEFGYALAKEKRLILVGHPENIFQAACAFEQYRTFEELLAALEKR